MIKTEFYKYLEPDIMLVKTYSTDNKYITQAETNLKYTAAIDFGTLTDDIYIPLFYTYTETNEEIILDTPEIDFEF